MEQDLAQGFQGLQDWQGELQGEGPAQMEGLADTGRTGATQLVGLTDTGRAGRTGGWAQPVEEGRVFQPDPVWPADTTSMEGPLEEGGMLQPESFLWPADTTSMLPWSD